MCTQYARACGKFTRFLLSQMEGDSPAQLPVAQATQLQAPSGQSVISQQQVPTGQPIKYQMPAQLPVAQATQAQAPSGQPMIYQQQVLPGQSIMYQMQPGQQQPGVVQVPVGQPVSTQDGQPVQYYVTRPVQPGQPVYVQGAPGQPVQHQQQAGLTIDTDFLTSHLCYIKIAEFVSTAFSFTAMFRFWRSSRK